MHQIKNLNAQIINYIGKVFILAPRYFLNQKSYLCPFIFHSTIQMEESYFTKNVLLMYVE
jgi:hypothetical protein